MVPTPSPSSKLGRSVSAKKDKIKSPDSKKEKEDFAQKEKSETGVSSPAKRNNNPGIRLIHGRIYDSENGKTCHQCRQKTRDFTASCKNLRNNKPCPINFCHKCLLNRYGEKAEEVGAMQEWVCPKCRGICNCSLCMKKRGHQPTGTLIRAAKANGYSSVSEMLQIIGPDNCQVEKSAKKRPASEMVPVTISPRKRGKENNFDGKVNSNLCALHSPSNLVQDKSKKVEVEGSNELNDSANDSEDGNGMPRKSKKLSKSQQERSSDEDCDSVLKKASPTGGEKKLRKSKTEGSNEKHDGDILKNGLMKHPRMNPDEKLKMREQDKLKEGRDARKKGITFLRRISPRKHHISSETNTDAKSNIDADLQERKLSKEKDSVKGSVESFKKDKGKQAVHDGDKNSNSFVKRTSPRKHQISNGNAKSKIDVDPYKTKLLKAKVYEEGFMEPCRDDKEKEEGDSSKHERSAESIYVELTIGNGTQASTSSEDSNKQEWTFENNDINVEIPLPEGFELTTVHDIEIPPEGVGKAFQFLEFCAVFGKILGVKKRQPEIVLRDLIQGRSSRRGKHSVTVQFIIQLLSVIQNERGQGSSALRQNGRNSWINALNECISESGSVSKSLDLESLDNKADGFEYLDSSKKLTIINFLCDEILGTGKLRNWIDKKTKEHKERVLAAKDKEKSLKQQMQDEIAKAIIQKNGAVLSISEHDAIISKIKREAAAAHTELVELNGLLLKKNQSSDVVRTQPIYVGIDGRAYWRLKCLSIKSASDILLQEVGTGDTSASDEKWFAFEDAEREVIEKHINSLRGKRLRARRVALERPPQNNEASCQGATE